MGIGKRKLSTRKRRVPVPVPVPMETDIMPEPTITDQDALADASESWQFDVELPETEEKGDGRLIIRAFCLFCILSAIILVLNSNCVHGVLIAARRDKFNSAEKWKAKHLDYAWELANQHQCA